MFAKGPARLQHVRSMPDSLRFNPACRRCSRLVRHLEGVRARYPSYHARPVGPFGDTRAKLLIVGLAPGMHGANQTGRPFTGDYAGILLYKTLFKHGFSSEAASRHRHDGLALRGCRITNAVKCLPPENRPTAAEIATCNGYLRHELSSVPQGGVILALGHIAHRAVVRGLGLRPSEHQFAHGRLFRLPDRRWLLDSYHCSRYNVQTGRLSEAMLIAVFGKARELLARNSSQIEDVGRRSDHV